MTVDTCPIIFPSMHYLSGVLKGDSMLTEKEKLDKLTMLGIELNQVKDLDILMERVLSDARRFVRFPAFSVLTG